MTITGRFTFKCLQNKVICKPKRKRMDSFIAKNKNLDRLITYSPSITLDSHNQLVNNPFDKLESNGARPTQNGTRL